MRFIFILIFYIRPLGLKFMQNCNQANPFVLSSDRLPGDPRLRASIANGYLGTIVYHKILHINGFYNGNSTNSTYVKVPNLIALWINDTKENVSRNYHLDMFNGVFVETISCESYNVSTRLYAHQYYKHVMITEINIDSSEDLTLPIERLGLPLDEIDDMKILEKWQNDSYTYLKVTSLVPETADVSPPNVTIISTTLPKFIKVKNVKEKFVFLMVVIITNGDDQRAWNEINNALTLAGNEDKLFDSHAEAWNKLWNEGGRIDIDGNCNLAQIVHASFYYIMSSLPMTKLHEKDDDQWPFYGICPSSLAQIDEPEEMYWGHVFWDQETWIVPPIQLFYPDVIKRILIQSRFRNLKAAKDKAEGMGYDGAMFPWESAYTGRDTSPWLPAVLREIHITGDIALALQQYIYYTKDESFVLKDGAYDVFCDIARFWASRVSYQEERNGYGVLDVMGPDEHHDHVNNSVYTNVVAQISLRLPSEIYNSYIAETGERFKYSPPNRTWLEIADKMYIPFDGQLQYHPEFDGFNKSEQIKQADVVLLGYPLCHPMKEDVRRNDLTIYQQVTSAEGPAMTWVMHTVGWLEVDEPQKAADLFQKNFAYIREPFKIWTENAQGFQGAVNFVTGMGGFLQVVLNGYFGIRVHRDRFEFKPFPIPRTNGYTISNMKYLGNIFDAKISKVSFDLIVKFINPSSTCLLKCHTSGSSIPFKSYKGLSFGKYSIQCNKNSVDD